MNNDSPSKALLVVLIVVLVTSSLVSISVVMLRPIQINNQLLDRGRNIVRLTGLPIAATEPSGEEMLRIYKALDARTLDLDSGWFDAHINPHAFDERRAANNPGLSQVVPPEHDGARLGRRSRYVPVYLVWNESEFRRIILPIHGSGMWSQIYGYIALHADLNTIADITFYEQNETPGLGDQIARPDWLAKWRGRRIYDEGGALRFAVSGGPAQPDSSTALYQVDTVTGATITSNAVTNLVRYWFGPHGYHSFLKRLQKQPPREQPPQEGD